MIPSYNSQGTTQAGWRSRVSVATINTAASATNGIVFILRYCGSAEIDVMSATGSEQRNLMTVAGFDWHPT